MSLLGWGVWLRLVILVVVGGGVGFFYGSHSALIAVAVLLLLMLLFHWWQLSKLMRWIQSGQVDEVPEGSGLWGDVFAALYHQQKAHGRDRAELAASLDRFLMAASVLPDGVVILDKEGRIEWFNHVASSQYGLDPTRDIGTPITHLVRQPEFAAYLSFIPSSQESLPLREPALIKAGNKGSERYSVSLIPFADDGRLMLSRDVTQIERADTMRRDFVANVSHELRTPLTVVMGFLEHMIGSESDPAMPEETRQRFLTLVQDQVGRMNRLVDDLLTLSRLENSAQLQNEEVVDVPALVAQVAEEGKALSRGRHTIQVESCPARIKGSLSELRSAFGNLVGNAVRYTPEGGRVTLSWGMEAGVPVFSVSDSGIGIAPEHLPRLTERFYRVDKGRSAATGGTGLGLAIVKHVLQHHQATLDIRSSQGEGSTFRAVFPLARLVPAHA
ncbi:phosphate regulon sensor histidine kinase PhoR [Denitratisoma sp. agr-D3]